jgi:NADPH2:quinone reductase
MRFGGRFCIVGWAATPFVAAGRGQGSKGKVGSINPNMLPTHLIQSEGLDVLGCPAVIVTTHDSSLRPTRLYWMMERIASGELRPNVGPSFPWSDFRDFLEAKWDREFVGGCVLHP